MTTDLVEIGHTKKPHGLKGEVKANVEERYLEDLLHADLVLLEIKGKATPFFVENVRVGNAIILKLEEVNSPDAALTVAGKRMWLRAQDIIPDNEREMEITTTPFAHCVGFTIFDGETEIGVIQEIVELPQSEMAIIHFNNKDVYIPLNQVFVKKIYNAAKRLVMALPEGLLDL